MTDSTVSMGDLKHAQHELSDLFMEFGHSMADTAAHFADVLEHSAPDVNRMRELGQQIFNQYDEFQRNAINAMEHANLMTPEAAAFNRQLMTEAAADFAERGAAAQQALGESMARYAAQARLANAVGNAAVGYEIAKGAYDAIQQGDPKPLAEALGNTSAMVIGGELGVITGAIIGGALVELLGLAGLLAGGLMLLAVLGMAILAGMAFKGLFGGLIGEGWDLLLTGISNYFTSGQFWVPRRDPLTLDLDGDGIESIGINTGNPITFDHDGDGVRTGTGWISSDDGFLVLDRNGNGTIDNGRELFGDSTPIPGGTASDGFAALAFEDTNHDGVVNASDANFANLRVWRDLNQNGTSESNELFTLTQLGIVGINVESVDRNQVLGNGNQIADVGTFIRADGTEGSVGETHGGTADVDLAENTFFREFPDGVPLAEGIEDLPNAPASGKVRDLWEAASISGGLRTTLESYSALTTREAQLAAIDGLLLTWAKTAGMKTMEQRADDIDHAFGWWKIGEVTYPGSGAAWSAAGGNPSGGVHAMPADFPDPNAWEQARANWDALVQRTENMFAVLEAFNGRYFFAMPEDTFQGARAGVLRVDSSGNGGGGSHAVSWGPPGIVIGIDTPQLDLLNSSYQMLRESIYSALVVQTRLEPVNDKILLHFTDAGMTYDFSDVENEFATRISQNAASGLADLLDYTRAQQRTFAGKEWRGWDLVADYVRSFGADPALAGLYSEFGVKILGASDTALSGDAKNNVIVGRAAASSNINGGEGNDALVGGSAVDWLSGDGGADTLVGLGGNDSLSGGEGEDILVGGAGNDWLTGGAGSDIYVFQRGDGQDYIDNSDWSGQGAHDTLLLGEGIKISDIRLSSLYGSLQIDFLHTTDRVVIGGDLFSDYNAIDQISFDYGGSVDLATLRDMVKIGGAGNDVFVGNNRLAALYGNDGNDSLTGGDGNDTIDGGNGNDVLIGGGGEDILYDVYGTNELRGGAGNDTITGAGLLEGGTGDDIITGTGNADVYLYNLGDGADTIYENGYPWIADTLRFGASITPEMLTLTRTADDMVLRFNESDNITIKGWFSNNWYTTIEQFEFANGTAWNLTNLQALIPAPYVGTENGETIAGWDGIDVIDGAAGNDTINGAAGNDQLAGGDGNDTINAGGGHDTVTGGAGDDVLNGDDGNDVIDGGDGNDTITDWYATNTLRGGAGNDTITGTGTIEGGTGNDVISGGGNADTYVFNLGDGADTIYENGYPWIIDTLQLGAGINAADLQLSRTGDDMVFHFNSSDQVTVKNWFSNNWYATVENLHFADGTTLDLPALQQLTPQAFTGTAGADSLAGWDGIDLIDGAEGNDTISGAAGNDQLAGGDGNDTINAGTGNDTVSGGAGDDVLNGDDGNDLVEGGDGNDTITDWYATNTLRGGAGNDTIAGTGTLEGGTGNDVISGGGGADTYLFNVGDGADTIYENGYPWIIDAIQFGAGISTSDISLARSGDDIVFRVGASDQITVKNWFSNNWYASIEQFRFADGTSWAIADVQAQAPLIYTGTANADNIAGWDGIDIIDGGGGNDTINGAAGNDQLTGGEGNDTINAGTGNDTVSGGAGDDVLNGDDGNDVIDGGDGNDTITDWYATNLLRGGAGNDTLAGSGTLEGGTGNDIISGSGSADTYVFNLGDGADTIYENGYPWIIDSLQLGAGISVADLQLVRSGDDMVFRFNASDQVTVKNWFSNNWYATVENLRFADGTTLDLPALQQLMPVAFTGTASGDNINGWDGIDVIDGAGGNDTINGAAGNDQLTGGDGNDTINAGTGNDTVSGGAGDDVLNGDDGNDVIDGGDGNDTITDWYATNTLRGGTGNDTIAGAGTLEGGTGNDIISGSGSADTYVFNLGDGTDTIYENGYPWIIDTLQLGAGINVADLQLARSGDDMVFKLNASDQVTVKNWFSNNWYATVENLRFADGTTLDLPALQQLTPQAFTGTANGDYINGWDGVDVIDGAGGNDTINGAAGNDQLTGGEGNDTINAGTGNDTVSGGAGDDVLNGDDGNDVIEGGDGNDTITDWYASNTLRGGAGNDTIAGTGTIEGGTGNDVISGGGNADTYLFNLGDGADTITENGYNWYIDTLQLGAGINVADLQLARTGDDMVFRFNATDQVTVKNWFSNTWYATIERLQFADGTALDLAGLQALTPVPYTGTANGDYLSGWDGIDVIDGAGGNDTINGAAGNDQLTGGEGNDTINAGTGNDVVSGGAGDDVLNGDDGNDVVEGGDGNDTITDWYAANTLRGGAGNDIIVGTGTIEGGTGNDTITGSGNPDTYVFNLGDGADTITENGYNWYIDTLKLGAGINRADLALARTGDDIVFKFNGTDQVTVKNWYSNNWYATVESLQFADGTSLDLAGLQQIVTQPYTATDSAESISGWDGADVINAMGGDDNVNTLGGNDVIDGGDGNDTLSAGNGNDTVIGGAGNDTIDGADGNDTIDGGDGNDSISDAYGSNALRGGAGTDVVYGSGTLSGGTGNDTITGTGGANLYLYDLGDGADVLNDFSYYNTEIDTLRFGAGVDPASVTAERSGNDLIFRINANDSIKVANWFYWAAWYGLERVEFADGTAWDAAYLANFAAGATTQSLTIGGGELELLSGPAVASAKQEFMAGMTSARVSSAPKSQPGIGSWSMVDAVLAFNATKEGGGLLGDDGGDTSFALGVAGGSDSALQERGAGSALTGLARANAVRKGFTEERLLT